MRKLLNPRGNYRNFALSLTLLIASAGLTISAKGQRLPPNVYGTQSLTSANGEIKFVIPDCWKPRLEDSMLLLNGDGASCTGSDPQLISIREIVPTGAVEKASNFSELIGAQGYGPGNACTALAGKPIKTSNGRIGIMNCFVEKQGTVLSLFITCGGIRHDVSTYLEESFDPAKKWTIDNIEPTWLRQVFKSFECAK